LSCRFGLKKIKKEEAISNNKKNLYFLKSKNSNPSVFQFMMKKLIDLDIYKLY